MAPYTIMKRHRVHYMSVSPIHLRSTDAAYLAGIFDGEGTICIRTYPPRSPRRPRIRFELFIAVAMTESMAVRAFKMAFGNAIHKQVRPQYDARRKPLYIWRATAWRAWRVLLTLKPFLRVKTKQVALAGTFMETFKRNSQFTAVTPNMQRIRCAVRERMGLLNHSHWRMKRINNK